MRKVFLASSMMAECDECGGVFDPVRGGICPGCERLLCDRHLFGGFFRRWHSYLGAHPRCVACRSGTPVAPPAERGARRR